MTSYRIAAVAAVSSAGACLSTLLYLPSLGSEPMTVGSETERAVPSTCDDAQATAEAERPATVDRGGPRPR